MERAALIASEHRSALENDKASQATRLAEQHEKASRREARALQRRRAGGREGLLGADHLAARRLGDEAAERNGCLLELLLGFDVDCCCFAWELGAERVVCTPRVAARVSALPQALPAAAYSCTAVAVLATVAPAACPAR